MPDQREIAACEASPDNAGQVVIKDGDGNSVMLLPWEIAERIAAKYRAKGDEASAAKLIAGASAARLNAEAAIAAKSSAFGAASTMRSSMEPAGRSSVQSCCSKGRIAE